jgi:hypothetical protein
MQALTARSVWGCLFDSRSVSSNFFLHRPLLCYSRFFLWFLTECFSGRTVVLFLSAAWSIYIRHLSFQKVSTLFCCVTPWIFWLVTTLDRLMWRVDDERWHWLLTANKNQSELNVMPGCLFARLSQKLLSLHIERPPIVESLCILINPNLPATRHPFSTPVDMRHF